VTQDTSLWAVNKDSSPLTIEFRGEEFTFVPNRTVKVSREMADLVFGHFSEDKVPTLIRLGWIKYNSDVPAGLERLAKIKISDQPPEETRLVASAGGVVPLYVQKAAGRKASAA